MLLGVVVGLVFWLRVYKVVQVMWFTHFWVINMSDNLKSPANMPKLTLLHQQKHMPCELEIALLGVYDE